MAFKKIWMQKFLLNLMSFRDEGVSERNLISAVTDRKEELIIGNSEDMESSNTGEFILNERTANRLNSLNTVLCQPSYYYICHTDICGLYYFNKNRE